MAPRYSRLGGGLVLLSLLHLIFLTPPKLVGASAVRDWVFLAPLTGGVLVGLALISRRTVRFALFLFVIPLIVSLKSYSFAYSRVERARKEQSRAMTELVAAGDGLTFSLRGGAARETGDGCAYHVDVRGISLCSPAPWRVRREPIGDDFPELELLSTEVAGVVVVVAGVVVDEDQSSFGPGIVQLRRISSFVRHHQGAVLLVMEGLPGMFSGSTIGFYEQAAVRELYLPHHFWRSVAGVFPVRLLGRGLRLVE